MLVGAVRFLNLTQAVGQLQSSKAHQATGNDHARLLLARELLACARIREHIEKLFTMSPNVGRCCRFSELNSSCREATELLGTLGESE